MYEWVDLYLPVCALKSQTDKDRTEADRKPVTALLFKDTHNLSAECIFIMLLNTIFARAETEIDAAET